MKDSTEGDDLRRRGSQPLPEIGGRTPKYPDPEAMYAAQSDNDAPVPVKPRDANNPYNDY